MDNLNEPVVVTRDGDACKVTVAGSVHDNVPMLEHKLKDVSDSNPNHVELDLSGIHYISTPALGAFITFRNQTVKNNGTVKVVAIDARVLGIFRHAHLLPMFCIDPTTRVTGEPAA